MGSTHYYASIGDGHVFGRRGPGPLLLDPILGMTLAVFAESTPPVENSIVTGGTSGAKALVRRVGVGQHTIESLNFLAFAPSETVSYDSGGTATVGFIGSPLFHQGASGPIAEKRDALLNTPIPDDIGSDNPLWDDNAKKAQTLILGAGHTGDFPKGSRCTTSAGGAFTVIKQFVIGSTKQLWIVRKSGTIAATNTVTNTTVAGSGTISSVATDPPRGLWSPAFMHPNWNGLADEFETIPMGMSTDGIESSYGPGFPILRKAHDKWKVNADPLERGVRFLQFSSTSASTGDANQFRGGVTVQLVRISGVVGTFAAGETVTGPGGWSGKVHNISSGGTRLYVHTVNGATLGDGTITGATSGATATADGPAYGWQPGSRWWNDFVAMVTEAHAATDALYSSQARHYDGLFLNIWETELGNFAPNEAVWPTEELAKTEWMKLITELRTLFGNDELPVTLMHMDIRSHLSDIQIGGLPFAYVLRQVFSALDQNDHISLTSTAGMEGATTAILPYPTSVLFLRTDDYLELGFRAFRAIEFASEIIPAGQFHPLILCLVGGQSQARQNIQSAIMSFDLDPDLFSSATFPGVNTIDPKTWTFNCQTQQWENFDIALNGNTFFISGAGTFAPLQAVLAARLKERFGDENGSAEVGFIHIPMNASSVDGSLPAAWTWDPFATSSYSIAASLTVTALGIPGNPLNPQRGRFTGAAGTFSEFTVADYANIAGSALGLLGSGGNNHWSYYAEKIYAIDPGGAWIELIGPHVAETATFTVVRGPLPLWPAARDSIRMALKTCVTQLNRTPKPVLTVFIHGENGLGNAAGYQAALTSVLNAIETEFGQKHKGEARTATVVGRLTIETPLGTDEERDGVRDATEAAVAALDNAAMLDTDQLPMESSGVFPRQIRQDNGVHHTYSGFRTMGFMVDELAGTLEGIPEHPAGSAAVELQFGAVDGGTQPSEGAGPSVPHGPSEPMGPGAAAAAAAADSIIETIDAALTESADVKAYTINGRNVERHSLSDLLEARKYYEAQAARAAGLRRTRVAFSS